MKRLKSTILLISLLIVVKPITIQANFFDNIKAELDTIVIKTIHKQADKKFYSLSYAKAINKYEKIIEKGFSPDSLRRNLAISYFKVNDTKKAEPLFAELVTNNEASETDIYFYAQSLKYNQKYDEADKWIEKYRELRNEDSRGKLQQGSEPVIREILSKVKYKIEPVYFNSEYSDFGAVVVNDKIIFTSGRNDQAIIQYEYSWKGKPYLDLYETPVEKPTIYTNANILTKGINSRFHDGPAFYSSDKQEIFLTRNSFHYGLPKYSEKKENHFMLYSAGLNEKGWEEMSELPFNSKDYSCGHPSISNDNSTLYFASDMPGGYGGSDIYFSTRSDSGWSEPVNMGKAINTEGDEMFPFISSSNELYFSSNGHLGLGGLDIFLADKGTKGNFTVVNMGHPLNSSADDFSFYLLPNGVDGYFASNREGGKGDDDIYTLTILDKPSAVFNLVGTAVDKKTGKVLPGSDVVIVDSEGKELFNGKSDSQGKVKFEGKPDTKYRVNASLLKYTNTSFSITAEKSKANEGILEFEIPLSSIDEWGVFGFIYNKESGKGVKDVEILVTPKDGGSEIKTATDPEGNFRELLKPETDYTILLKKKKFFTKRGDFTTKGMEPGWIDVKEFIEVEMEEIVVGKTIEIPNIYYDLGKWNIRDDAAKELDEVVQFLKDNETITIELGSHTDARGNNSSNQTLSQKRAESAVEYIVSSGIDQNRITAKGYGEEKLKNRCADGVRCSEDEHQENRRTEITIVDF
jgi:outer membrane protein OmpA-like peptidoglycan-associated protein